MSGNGKLLKIYIGESDHHHGGPLYHAIIKTIQARGLTGATAIRGIDVLDEKIHAGVRMALQDVEIIRYSHDTAKAE